MSIHNPSLSVVLPAYNAAKYIRPAVTSILNQTFKDIELIVVNDGSTDETLKILRDLQKLDSRLLIISRENQGLVRSLNEGIAAARGKWIARMDADDISTPDRIHKQLAYAEKQKLDICGAYVRIFGFCRPSIRKYPITPAAANLQLAFNTCFAHPTVIARAQVLKEHPYNERFEKIEDYELWTRLAAQEFRLGNIPEALLYYRRTFSQATNVHRKAQDRMRISIASDYAKTKMAILPLDILQSLLSRTSEMDDSRVMQVALNLHELIATGHDVERILANNLNLFLVHNGTALGNESWRNAKALLPRRGQILINVMRIIGLHPGHKLWNFLYLLK